MSTIAYRDGFISGDSIMTKHDQLCDGIEKVGRTENYLFGFAGRLNFLRPTYRWVASMDEQGIDPEDFYLHADALDLPDSGSAIIVNRSLQVYMVALDGYATAVNRSFEAIGSGGDYAIGALLHGASAEEAVSCASMVDAHSGGMIHTWSFDKKVHCPNEKTS